MNTICEEVAVMGDNKFPSLSNFLTSTKKIERNTMEASLNQGTEEEVQRILSQSSVILSVMNNQSNRPSATEATVAKSNADIIQQGIQEAAAINAARIKSILDDIFSNLSLEKEREEFWINKLSNQFNINPSLSLEEKKALIEKQLAEDDDTLNYVTYLVEAGEKKNRS